MNNMIENIAEKNPPYLIDEEIISNIDSIKSRPNQNPSPKSKSSQP